MRPQIRPQALRSAGVRSGRFAVAALLMAMAGLFALPVCADRAMPNEYQIKTAYLHNILKFVRWPPAKPGATMNICLYGDNPFGKLLANLDGLTVQDYQLQTRHVNEGGSLASCQVVYVVLPTARIRDAIERAAPPGALVIGESAGFIDAGGVVGFIEEGDSVRYEINNAAARARGLSLQSQLLESARRVR